MKAKLPVKIRANESKANWSVRVLRAWQEMGYPDFPPGIEAEQVKLAHEIQNRLGYAPQAGDVLHPPQKPAGPHNKGK